MRQAISWNINRDVEKFEKGLSDHQLNGVGYPDPNGNVTTWMKLSPDSHFKARKIDGNGYQISPRKPLTSLKAKPTWALGIHNSWQMKAKWGDDHHKPRRTDQQTALSPGLAMKLAKIAASRCLLYFSQNREAKNEPYILSSPLALDLSLILCSI